jgi:hypothetical protein
MNDNENRRNYRVLCKPPASHAPEQASFDSICLIIGIIFVAYMAIPLVKVADATMSCPFINLATIIAALQASQITLLQWSCLHGLSAAARVLSCGTLKIPAVSFPSFHPSILPPSVFQNFILF